MSILRRLATVLITTALLVGPANAAWADEKDSEATAVNTEDGASIFRFALSIQEVSDGVVDQTNTASAQASCVDCTTVAVAFQVILVSGEADVVTPENRAEAVNSECQECLTYAAATQIVIQTDGKELSDNGKRRLKELEKRMHDIEQNADSMTDAELLNATQEAEAELIAIFEEELVPIGSDPPGGSGEPTTTTSSTTSTTVRTTSTTTSTTSPPSTTSTTT